MPVHLLNSQLIQPHLSYDSGWNYVTAQTSTIVSSLSSVSPLYVDLFVDRTFLWERGDLPHRLYPWLGVLHHPPGGVPNSCDDLFSCAPFAEALDNCLALIVFTEALEFHARTLLQLWSLTKRGGREGKGKGKLLPSVHFLYHPVNLALLWQLRSAYPAQGAPRNRLVHIGHHGRELEPFYRLFAPGFEKVILSNDQNIPHHICDAHTQSLHGWLSHALPTSCGLGMTPPLSCGFNNQNLTMRPAREVTWTNWTCSHQPCRVVPRLSVEEYASTLNSDIVYIHLTDASAVNTLLECIVFRTPVFVNRIPAVEELLGLAYPMYCDSELEVEEMLNSEAFLGLIDKTVDYLSRLDLQRFHIRHFRTLICSLVERYNHGELMKPVIMQLDAAPPGKLLPLGGKQFRRMFRSMAEPAGIRAQERRRELRDCRNVDDTDLAAIVDLYCRID